MRRITILALVLILIMAIFMPACSRLIYVTGTGNATGKPYSLSDFSEIEVSGAFEIAITPSSSYGVSIETQESLFDYINISQTGKTLKIGLKPVTYEKANFKANVSLPLLGRLDLSGASHGSALGFKSGEDFELTSSGAGNLVMDIEAGAARITLSEASKAAGHLKAADVNTNISGASRLELSGSVDKLILNVSEASEASLPDFIAQNAEVILGGASKSSINVAGKLDVDITGESSLEYSGNPILGKVSVTGASSFNPK